MTDDLLTARGVTFRDVAPRSVGQLLSRLDRGGQGDIFGRVYSTGFPLLDQVLDGGLRAQDLTLLGGVPGVGKTILALQMARNLAASGRSVVYACYEHDQQVLLGRLLLLELGALDPDRRLAHRDDLRQDLKKAALGQRSLDGLARREPLIDAVRQRMSAWMDHLVLVRASGAHTGVGELADMALQHQGEEPVVVVDYLQKVAVRPEPSREDEKVRRIAEELKELALRQDTAVLAVVAADKEGLTARRLRLHHLRGSTALAYECDVAIMLNDKAKAVSNVHLAYDTVKAETFRHWVVCSIEKNRGGEALIDLELHKDFANYRFRQDARWVAERLLDERIEEA